MGVINHGKEMLWLKREEREHPLLDDKALASWNGLMLRAFAEAGAALERQDYLDAATKNADFLLTALRPNGKLLRSYREGQAKLPGFLEDYSFVADGLLALYEATFERRWLDSAVELADEMITLFWDEPAGAFYDTGRDHEQLVVRPRDVFDNAQPCGGSVASDLLLRLSVVTGNEDYATRAITPMRTLAELMGRAPAGTGRWLAALDFYLSTPKEVAIIGPSSDPATADLLKTVNSRYLSQPRGRRSCQPKRRVGFWAAAAGRSRHGGREADRICLRELRLSVAGHRYGVLGLATRRAVVPLGRVNHG